LLSLEIAAKKWATVLQKVHLRGDFLQKATTKQLSSGVFGAVPVTGACCACTANIADVYYRAGRRAVDFIVGFQPVI
jgi:hypothetical protein